MPKYATKADLKHATGKSDSAAKSDLASLKAEIDKMDIDKLVSVPVELSKRSELKYYVVKKNCV